MICYGINWQVVVVGFVSFVVTWSILTYLFVVRRRKKDD